MRKSTTQPSSVTTADDAERHALRTALAAFAALAGLGWVAERALNLDNPLSMLIEDLAAHALWLAAALAVAALLATAWERLTGRSARS